MREFPLRASSDERGGAQIGHPAVHSYGRSLFTSFPPFSSFCFWRGGISARGLCLSLPTRRDRRPTLSRNPLCAVFALLCLPFLFCAPSSVVCGTSLSRCLPFCAALALPLPPPSLCLFASRCVSLSLCRSDSLRICGVCPTRDLVCGLVVCMVWFVGCLCLCVYAGSCGPCGVCTVRVLYMCGVVYVPCAAGQRHRACLQRQLVSTSAACLRCRRSTTGRSG